MKLLNKLLIPAVALALAAPSSLADNLVILATNDTHSQIDPAADDDLGGVARRKVVIDSVRRANENVLLVDAGDIVQGTLFFNLYKGEVEEKLMNAMGYDIRILGNHEFDNGMQALADNLADADADLLCLNYLTDDTPLRGLFDPYVIKEYDGKRIALMGINLRPEGMISARNAKGLGYIDAIEAANHAAWWLKNIERVDYVVAVTHIGYKPTTPPGDVMLAGLSEDIDVIIGGHSHTMVDPNDMSTPHLVRNTAGRGVLVTQAAKMGKYVAEITIDLDSLNKTPDYKLIRIDSRLDNRTDPAIEKIISPYRAEVDLLNKKAVARTARALPKESQGLLNYVADFVMHRGRQLADSVDFAIINKGGIRNSLPQGTVTEGQIITMMPFFNKIQVIDIYGRDLVPAFNQMARVDGNGVSRGVDVEYDPETDVCGNIVINGRKLDSDRIYRVASIDYLIEGGDYMHSLTKGTVRAESPAFMFEDMLEYLRNGAGKGKKINPDETVRMHPVK